MDDPPFPTLPDRGGGTHCSESCEDSATSQNSTSTHSGE